MLDKTNNKKTVLIQIEPETGMAIATCSGILRFNDAKEGALALWKSTDWAGRSVVWDFREAQFDITSSETQNIAIFILENQPEPPALKIAFVTKREVDFGMARMFEVYREDKRTMVQIFRDYEEAICWARLPIPNSI